jgi:large conductance mechanosensitive channel
MLRGFKDFVMRGNVIDLAVAVVIGAAFTAVVTAFVSFILTPLIAAIAGKPDFSELTFTINDSKFFYGAFINALIAFLLVAAAVYFFIVMPLNTVAERRAAKLAAGEPDPEPKPEEIILLEQIRDLLAKEDPFAKQAAAADRPKPS